MKKLTATLLATVLSPLIYASEQPSDVILDKIAFQLTAKQWVSTKTALLSVNINATLSNADLVKARADIMGRLEKIAQGEWHLTRFDRSQDSSGLEKLSVNAQARVPQEALTAIYQNAKTVSKPGANYSIVNVEFKPSLEEIQTVRASVRANLYQQVNEELKRINQNYSKQNYSLYSLEFIEDNQATPMAYKAREMNVMAMASAPNIAVSNELLISATVVAASNRPKGNDLVKN